MENIKSKRGRPVTGQAKNNRLNVRLSDEYNDMINYICEKKGITKTDVLEEAIRMQYNLAKFMDENV